MTQQNGLLDSLVRQCDKPHHSSPRANVICMYLTPVTMILFFLLVSRVGISLNHSSVPHICDIRYTVYHTQLLYSCVGKVCFASNLASWMLINIEDIFVKKKNAIGL